MALVALLPVAAPAAANEGPKWKLTVTPNAEYVLPGSQYSAEYKIEAENVGDEPTSSSEGVTIENVPPAGTSSENAFLFNSEFGYANLANFGMCPTPGMRPSRVPAASCQKPWNPARG